MVNSKALLVGCLLGALSALSGLAKADCSRDGGWDVYPSGIAAQAAEGCPTTYGEVVADNGDEAVVWCVPDSVAEGCIEVSSLLDCSVMSAEACDVTMGVMFEACVRLAYSASR